MCGHRLYKDLLLISLLLVSSDCSEDAAWTEELLEGEQVESMCDSFLQTSLHVAPSEQLNGQLTRKSHKKDPALDGAPGTVEELPVMAQPLSFLQADEVVETPKDEAYADSIVVDEGRFQNPNVLRWGTLFLNHLLIFMIVVKGGLSFSRLILRKRQASCTSLAPDPQKEEEKTRACLIHQQVNAIPSASAEQVEELCRSASSGYDCAFSKPASIGRALRFRARIYGTQPGASALVAPLSEDACVLYKTSVSLPEAADDTEKIIHKAERVDFLATLEGTPDVQILVRGEEVKMFHMRSGQTAETLPLSAAPTHWQSFVSSDSPTHGSAGLRNEHPLMFKEETLRIGELVTLVGDLHKDVAGQLMLWPAPKSAGSETGMKFTHQDELQLFDGVHVLVSDDQFAEHASQDPEP